MSTNTLYTKPACPACEELKMKLRRTGQEFIEVKLNTHDVIDLFKARYPTVKSVPFLVDDDANPVVFR